MGRGTVPVWVSVSVPLGLYSLCKSLELSDAVRCVFYSLFISLPPYPSGTLCPFPIVPYLLPVCLPSLLSILVLERSGTLFCDCLPCPVPWLPTLRQKVSFEFSCLVYLWVSGSFSLVL